MKHVDKGNQIAVSNYIHTLRMLFFVLLVTLNVLNANAIQRSGVDVDTFVVADFSYEIDSFTKLAHFNNTSYNSSIWLWQLGDSTGSTAQNVTHYYKTSDSFNVCLSVANIQFGTSGKICKTVVVPPSPCDVSATFSYVADGQLVTFTNASTGSAVNYYWLFDDGSASAAMNPIHNFERPGIYHVSLVISDASMRCTDYFLQTVEVGTVVCNASFDATVQANTKTVSFTNLSTGNIARYYWDFGDGNNASGNTVSHAYKANGSYTVALTVSNDDLSCSDHVEKTVQIGVANCNAAFTYFVDTLTSTAYFSDNMAIDSAYLLYTFGDGSTSAMHNPSHTYLYEGFYNVSLSAYQLTTGCMDYREATILVGNRGNDCASGFSFSVGDDGKTVQFFDNSQGDIVKYVWNFGGKGISESQNPTFKFNKSGIYNVCQTVVNAQHISNISCKEVVVAVAGSSVCKANFNVVADQVSNKVIFTDASIGAIDTWKWSFGDKKGSSAQNPIYTYNSKGYYLVSLLVSDVGKTCTDKTYKLVPVNEVSHGLRSAFGADQFASDTKAGGYPVDFVGAGLGDQARLRWNFGDSTNNSQNSDSTTTSPEHTYNSTGTYNVCYEISDPITGMADTACQLVDVQQAIGLKPLASLAASDMRLYPNPVNDVVNIEYQLMSASSVEISVFDVAGKNVQTIVHTQKPLGMHLLRWNAAHIKSGMYVVRIAAGNNIQSRIFEKR